MPRISRRERASISLSISLTGTQYAGVQRAAVLDNISLAEVIRGLIDDWIAANPEFDLSDEIVSLNGVTGISRVTMDKQAALGVAKKSQSTSLIRGWPLDYPWRSEPPKGSPGVALEVDIWLQEARGTNNPARETPWPGSAALDRPLGTPVDDWQAGLRVALGLPAQPEDVDISEAV